MASEQFDLFRYPKSPGYSDPDTSRKAAESIAPSAAIMREMVFKIIKRAGEHGMTCDELEVILRMKHQTCSARCRELVLAGRVRDTGRRRPTRSGRPANVYEVVK